MRMVSLLPKRADSREGESRNEKGQLSAKWEAWVKIPCGVHPGVVAASASSDSD